MHLKRINKSTGYSLFELIIVIVIIAIIVSVSVKSLKNSVEVSRIEETKIELDQLAYAISGNPNLVSGGARTDFGYVGDIGSIPSNLDALVTNPGYGTWDGPYLRDDYYASTGGSESEFKIDGWGVTYTYSGGVTISSTGGSTTITRQIANSSGDLLYNSVSAVITDINHSPPGSIYKDSIRVNLDYPDGVGSVTSVTKYPGVDGFVQFDSIPVGNHRMQIIYLPGNDTLTRITTVNPGSNFFTNISLYVNLFGSGGSTTGGIEYVSGSAKTKGGNCEKIEFDITNTSSVNITITNITLTWSTPTAYYEKVKWDGDEVFDENNPRAGTGNVTPFDNSKVINSGETITIKVEKFRDVSSGGGNNVDMSNTDMTVTFSDGTIINFNTGTCN